MRGGDLWRRTSSASSSEAYFVRGQKKPRRPSPLVRGTTWACRCGTDCDTWLFIATNVPPAPSPVSTATASRWTKPKKGASDVGGQVGQHHRRACRGTTSTCPLNTGRMSRNATRRSVEATRNAGTEPATMRTEQATRHGRTLAG